MNKRLYTILCIVTLSVFVLIFVQEKTTFIHFKKLAGVTSESEFPALTFEGYKDGSMQKSLEEYSRQHFGFREWSLRLYNQYKWTFFKQSTNSHVALGKNGYLYETYVVLDQYQSLMTNIADDSIEVKNYFDGHAERLFKIQQILKEYGVYLFANVLPSKNEIYPEYLPADTATVPPGIRAINYVPRKFDQLGLQYLDLNLLCKQIKDSVDYPLFPRTGTHWSRIAAAHLTDTILSYMEHLSGINLHDVRIGEMYEAKSMIPDDDLEQLMNLVFPIKPNKNYYSDLTLVPDPTAKKPKVIVIGDSFFWTLSHIWPLEEMFDYCHYWYYFSTVYFDDQYFNVSQFDLLQQMLSSDFIVLSYSAAQLYNFDRGFIPKALLALGYDESKVDSVKNEIVAHIKNDSAWFHSIEQKSMKENTPIEDAIMSNAEYMLYSHPELYFEELATSEVPKCRNSRIDSLLQAKQRLDE